MVGSRKEEEEEVEQTQAPHTKARSRIRDITNIITTRLKSFMGRSPKHSAESSHTNTPKERTVRNNTPGWSEDDVRVFPTSTQAEDADAFLEDTSTHNDKNSDCHSKAEFCNAKESSTSDDSDVSDAVLSEGEESSTSDDDDHPGAAPEGEESSTSSDDDDQPGAAPEGEESSSSSSDDDHPGVEVSNTSLNTVSRDNKSIPDDAVHPNTVLYDAEESSTSDDDVDTTTSSEDDYEASLSLSPEHFMLDDHVSGGALPPMSVPIEDMEGNAAADEMGDNNVCDSLEANAPCNDMGDFSADDNDDSDNTDFDMEDDLDYDDVDDYDDDSDYDTGGDSDEDSDDDIEDIFIEGEGGGLAAEHHNTTSSLDDADDHHD
ncbi:hypothetical protein O3P69_008603 [Scylla paramamosain]